MGKSERDKGNRIEREIVEAHRKIGVWADRVPLSGAVRYRGEGHDVNIYPLGADEVAFSAEVKARASGAGFTMLEKWLADYDLLFLRRDRAEPLVVVPWNTWVTLMKYIQTCPDADHSTSTRLSTNGEHDAAT